MLTSLGSKIRRTIATRNPWTNVYGTARSALALGTLGTLLFSDTATLFRPAVGIPTTPICVGLARISLFCQVPYNHLEWARWSAIAILFIVASGWRPRITGMFHWWVAFSFMVSVLLVDGGDQITADLALLLVPLTLTDSRAWHWQSRIDPSADLRSPIARLIALSSLFIVRVQVAGLYFHAVIAKFQVTEWKDGTATYYWFLDPFFGATPVQRFFLTPLLTNPVAVVLFTWGALAIETFLFTGLVMDKRYRNKLLVLGLVFHGGIALIHGLISFTLAMSGALILYLRPIEQEFNLKGLVSILDRMKKTRLTHVSFAPGGSIHPNDTEPAGAGSA